MSASGVNLVNNAGVKLELKTIPGKEAISQTLWMPVGKGWFGNVFSSTTSVLIFTSSDIKLVLKHQDFEEISYPLPKDKGRYQILALAADRFAVIAGQNLLLFRFNSKQLPECYKQRKISWLEVDKSDYESVHIFNNRYLVRHNSYESSLKLQFIDCEQDCDRELSSKLAFPGFSKNIGVGIAVLPLNSRILVMQDNMPKISFKVELEKQGSKLGEPKKLTPGNFVELGWATLHNRCVVSPDGVYCTHWKIYKLYKLTSNLITEVITFKDKAIEERLQNSFCLGFLPDNRMLILDNPPRKRNIKRGAVQDNIAPEVPKDRLSVFDLKTNEFTELTSLKYGEDTQISPEGEVVVVKNDGSTLIFPMDYAANSKIYEAEFAIIRESSQLYDPLCRLILSYAPPRVSQIGLYGDQKQIPVTENSSAKVNSPQEKNSKSLLENIISSLGFMKAS